MIVFQRLWDLIDGVWINNKDADTETKRIILLNGVDYLYQKWVWILFGRKSQIYYSRGGKIVPEKRVAIPITELLWDL